MSEKRILFDISYYVKHCLMLALVTHSAKNKFWEVASSFVMTTLSDNCQSINLNNAHPMETELLKFPLVNSMQVLFTGHFNGLGVEVRSFDEIGFLYNIGCFGKGSFSRSQPTTVHPDQSTRIMRERQFLKRNYWYQKFVGSQKNKDGDLFFKHINELMTRLVDDGKKRSAKDIIDLVSTDDDDVENIDDSSLGSQVEYNMIIKQDIAVIVPNSDSEDDDYFSTMKPKGCLNKVKLEEKLMLSLQEAFFLVYILGCLQIMNLDKILNVQECWDLFVETEPYFIEKYIVYHYLRSKGYVVKPGIKFGGDYLLYREGPGVNHADYIVVVKHKTVNFDWISLLGHVRMANTTVKEVMIAEVVRSAKGNIKLPDDLCEYSVREIVLTRNIPVTINNDDEYSFIFIYI